MRASRLLSILLLLQTRGRLTARELAGELEVSLRTIYRDVDSLSAAGVPVYADHGPAGGYRLVDGYRTRLTGLTPDEADSLFLAGAPGPAAELGLGTVLAGAQLKLLAALPPELRARASRIRERFHLDAPGWFRDIERPPYLAEVADAVWNQRVIRVRYQRWTGEVTRQIEPLGIVLKGGVWYVAARATRQVRTYRVSRVLDLTKLDDGFERPAGFDLSAYWQAWSDQFQRRLYGAEAVIRLSPRALELLPYFFNPVAVDAARAQAEPPDAAGWVRTSLPIESLQHAYRELLRLGADAEVLAPPELRERIAGTAKDLMEIYGPSGR